MCLRSKGYNPVSVWDSGLQFKPQKLIPASSSAVNVLCSTARLCCRISPLLSAFWKEKDLELGIFCVSQPHSLYLLEPGGSRKALLWSCTHGSYQPLLEGTVSHEDPHAAAQHHMHLGVGEALWLCWLHLDLAERPDFMTSKGFSLPEM